MTITKRACHRLIYLVLSQNSLIPHRAEAHDPEVCCEVLPSRPRPAAGGANKVSSSFHVIKPLFISAVCIYIWFLGVHINDFSCERKRLKKHNWNMCPGSQKIYSLLSCAIHMSWLPCFWFSPREISVALMIFSPHCGAGSWLACFHCGETVRVQKVMTLWHVCVCTV